MNSEKKFDSSIILRFLINEASAVDITLLEDWISRDAKNKRYFERVRDSWNSLEVEKELDAEKIDQDFQNILYQINAKKALNIHGMRHLNKILGSWVMRGAAAFLFGVAVSWGIFQNFDNSEANNPLLNVVETPRGSRANIVLPDGSKVLLNAESKITYPQQFLDEKREILLEGEAYFEIRKDPKTEFLVITQDLVVKVFGTSFNVKSYPGENTAETTLVEGSISVYKQSTNGKIIGSELKMEPNQHLVLYKDQKYITPTISRIKKIENVPARKAKLVLSKRIDTERFISWKDGELKIITEPMKNIAVTLERRYDVKIHFLDEDIKQLRFSGTFKNETIEQVLAAMKLASPITYKIEERDIWLSNNEDFLN